MQPFKGDRKSLDGVVPSGVEEPHSQSTAALVSLTSLPLEMALKDRRRDDYRDRSRCLDIS